MTLTRKEMFPVSRLQNLSDWQVFLGRGVFSGYPRGQLIHSRKKLQALILVSGQVHRLLQKRIISSTTLSHRKMYMREMWLASDCRLVRLKREYGVFVEMDLCAMKLNSSRRLVSWGADWEQQLEPDLSSSTVSPCSVRTTLAMKFFGLLCVNQLIIKYDYAVYLMLLCHNRLTNISSPNGVH